MRSTRLYPKHEASSFMELFTNLIRVTSLVRLSLSLSLAPLLDPFSSIQKRAPNNVPIDFSTTSMQRKQSIRSGRHFTSL